jgi:hypothetical protein
MNEHQTTITLKVVDGQWMSQWGGPETERIIELFGTDTVPTPYLEAMAGAEVRGRIQELNPDARVILATLETTKVCHSTEHGHTMSNTRGNCKYRS